MMVCVYIVAAVVLAFVAVLLLVAGLGRLNRLDVPTQSTPPTEEKP